MFIYEKDGKLNVMFQATQIPAKGTPDVVLYKEDNTVTAEIGGHKYQGTLPTETKAAETTTTEETKEE